MCLFYDYDTPFRELDKATRKNRSAIQAGYAKSKKTGKHTKKTQELLDGKLPHLQLAVRVFMGLQKDIDREAMEAYNDQIEQFIAKSKEPKETDKDWELALKLNKALPDMLRARQELKDLLGLRGMEIEDDTEELDSSLMLSTLDLYNEELIDKTR